MRKWNATSRGRKSSEIFLSQASKIDGKKSLANLVTHAPDPDLSVEELFIWTDLCMEGRTDERI